MKTKNKLLHVNNNKSNNFTDISDDIQVDGKSIHFCMVRNPSHLEVSFEKNFKLNII